MLSLGLMPYGDRTHDVDKVWQARECGDGYCDEPLEFPAFGSLGCRVDCGLQRTLVPVLIVIHTDLTRLEGTSEHMQELWRTVRWNLCTRRTHATVMHLQPLCWYSEDRHLPRYSSRAMTTSEEFELPPGRWYIRILGDAPVAFLARPPCVPCHGLRVAA
eukprot:gene28939-35953_t